MSVEGRRAVMGVVSMVGVEAAVVVGVHLVGRAPSIGVDWSDPAGWLAVSPAEQVVASMAWLAASVMAYWLLGSTLLYLVARCWRLRGVLRVAEWLTVPAVRRMVDRALAATLVGTVLLGPAAPALATGRGGFDAMTAAPPQSEYEPQPAGSEQPPVSAPGPRRDAPKPVEQDPPDDEADAESESPRSRATEQAGDGDKESGVSTGSSDDGRPERPATRTSGVPRPGHRYTVRVGDHLWKIASEVVAGGDGMAGRAAVASYWAELVREATPGLRSGNPDLIYPGEQITLPQLTERAREDDDRRRP
jgi:hypothetical protein